MLGPEGAAQFQRRLTVAAASAAAEAGHRRGLALEIRHQGGSALAMRGWLGGHFRFRPQGAGDIGARGMVVSDPELTFVPGVRITGPVDPTGAGDSATAGAVLALAAGASLPEAALAGNLVASITVQQLATTGTATPQQVRERLEMWREQQGTR